MSVVQRFIQREPLPALPTYIGYCCREWICPYGYLKGKCGLCGQRPTFLREDPDSRWTP